MDNINVSVIVPVFNCEEYIGITLDSIINQDFDGFEIIVIDDGSTDKSLKVINDKLRNSNIPNKIIYQENSGVSVARNAGIRISKGDYLVFVDADDIISPKHLSTLYNGKTDFSLIQYVKKDGENLSKPYNFSKESLSTEEFIKMELNMEFPFKFFQLMYRSEIVKNHGILFTKGIVYGEDTEFAHKALSKGKDIAISNEVTYYYVQRPDSAINTTDFKRFQIIEVFENLSDYYKNEGKKEFSDLIDYIRIPKAIFGNMNFFFVNGYDFDEVMAEMEKLDLFRKLSKFKGEFKFKMKVKLFLSNPQLYYKSWKKFKNSID